MNPIILILLILLLFGGFGGVGYYGGYGMGYYGGGGVGLLLVIILIFFLFDGCHGKHQVEWEVGIRRKILHHGCNFKVLVAKLEDLSQCIFLAKIFQC